MSLRVVESNMLTRKELQGKKAGRTHASTSKTTERDKLQSDQTFLLQPICSQVKEWKIVGRVRTQGLHSDFDTSTPMSEIVHI